MTIMHVDSRKALAILLAGGSCLLALLTSLRFVAEVESLIEAHDGTWSDVFAFHEAGFRAGLRQSVEAWLWPTQTLRHLGAVQAGILLLMTVLVGAYTYGVIRRQDTSWPYLLPAMAPLLVGLAMAPLRLRGLVYSAYPLAEQGLTHFGAAGSGVGEALVPVWVGLVFSVFCWLLMLWSRWSPDLENRTGKDSTRQKEGRQKEEMSSR